MDTQHVANHGIFDQLIPSINQYAATVKVTLDFIIAKKMLTCPHLLKKKVVVASTHPTQEQPSGKVTRGRLLVVLLYNKFRRNEMSGL